MYGQYGQYHTQCMGKTNTRRHSCKQCKCTYSFGCCCFFFNFFFLHFCNALHIFSFYPRAMLVMCLKLILNFWQKWCWDFHIRYCNFQIFPVTHFHIIYYGLVSDSSFIVYLRARRALMLFKDVTLRTIRALLLYKVYCGNTLLVLNGTWLTDLMPFWLSADNMFVVFLSAKNSQDFHINAAFALLICRWRRSAILLHRSEFRCLIRPGSTTCVRWVLLTCYRGVVLKIRAVVI